MMIQHLAKFISRIAKGLCNLSLFKLSSPWNNKKEPTLLGIACTKTGINKIPQFGTWLGIVNPPNKFFHQIPTKSNDMKFMDLFSPNPMIWNSSICFHRIQWYEIHGFISHQIWWYEIYGFHGCPEVGNQSTHIVFRRFEKLGILI